jgi:hypothetical protein
MIKALPWVLFCLALLAAIYLLVLLLDAGMALDNSRTQTSHLRQRSELALTIVRKEWVGKDATQVVDLSKELEQQGVIVGPESKSAFGIGDFIFETKDGVVTNVRYID